MTAFSEGRSWSLTIPSNPTHAAHPRLLVHSQAFIDNVNPAPRRSSSGTTTWRLVLDGDSAALIASPRLGAGDDEGTAVGPYGINTTEQFLTVYGRARYISAPGSRSSTLLLKTLANASMRTSAAAVWTVPIARTTFRRTSAYASDTVYIAPQSSQCQT
ncbi:hypothetical protein FOMPIDRAFT_1048488 [Fomitopsis schrenkii]|uniref:Uncharacterized protein n=1 Tax=Fomitopsis schrenkii TaxID=2126942 RepID=S8FUI4_FOMSC|nr:hypothetical protein FOMPIDRAFT_1048488 [Fomitopsis schrenkii]